jgi:hypothetical protein
MFSGQLPSGASQAVSVTLCLMSSKNASRYMGVGFVLFYQKKGDI